jgi:FHA domain-containing protein
MAKLILSMDGLVLKEVALSKERVTVGRKPHNDIQIDNMAISGEHAAIVTILNDSFLEDMNSTNGTYVNGQPIKKHFLQNNDVIELGKYRLKFLTEQAAPSPAADYERTLILRPETLRPASTEAAAAIRPGDAPRGDASVAPQPQPPGAALGPTQPSPAAPDSALKSMALAAIRILNGVNAGRELELTKTLTTLGKPGVQVAVISRRPQGYYITHAEGAGLPRVNGQALGTQAHPLQDHDVVEIAGVRMEFFLKT